MNKSFNLHNQFHLGDCIFNIHFFNQYLNDEKIIFNFYVNPFYFDELKKHIKNKNIILHSIINGIPEKSHCLWIGHNGFYHNWINNSNYYDLFYVDFFKMISEQLGIESKINSNVDMLFDNSNYEISIPNNYDYLIVNSTPMSGQFHYVEDDFVKLCDYLNLKGFSFVTTKKFKDYDCTLDYNMSIVDIGNLSNNCKNIIAINTAPIITTFTKTNIDKTDKRFILDSVLTYSYNEKIFQIKDLKQIYDFL